MKFAKLAILLCIVLFAVSLAAQEDAPDNIDEALSSLSNAAGKAYVGPIVHAFGADFNTGWFTRTPKAKMLGVDVSFKLVMMGAMLDDSGQTFATEGDFHLTQGIAEEIADTFDWTQYGAYGDELRQNLIDQLLGQDYFVGIGGPTVTGDKDEHMYIVFRGQDFTIESDDGTVIETIHVEEQQRDTPVTGLLDKKSSLILYTPQFTFGTIQGTNVTIRFLPGFKIKDFGDLDFWGVGVQHNPKVWLDKLVKFAIPVDLSLQASTQQMTVENIITATSWNFGINISKNIGVKFLNIEPYVGAMVEGANIEFKYDYEYELTDTDTGISHTVSDTIKFDMDSDNATRFIAGVAARIGQFELNADYNISEVDSYCLGLGLGFTF